MATERVNRRQKDIFRLIRDKKKKLKTRLEANSRTRNNKKTGHTIRKPGSKIPI